LKDILINKEQTLGTKNWTASEIEDLDGKVVIVTGANTGLGKETAKQLALKNATVILAVRNIAKGKIAVKEIQLETPKAKLEVMKLDLSSLESIKNFVGAFGKKYKKLDILINNAGVMNPPFSTTKEGFELQFGTNHLGHFALTVQLLPALKNAKKARIVTVSSVAHTSGNIDFNDLHWKKRDYRGWKAYGDSKIANLFFTYELARKLKGTSIIVVAAHPGYTATDLQRTSPVFVFLNLFLAQKPSMGALPTLRAALDSSVKSGEYYGPGGRSEFRGYPVRVKSNDLSYDKEIAKQLWQVSEKLTGEKFSI
jgi:NAD(P)-dependent dehydrogenase (short-subunit alcohol dehydrogenase family)